MIEEHIGEIIVAGIAAIGAWYARRGKQHAESANDAVNLAIENHQKVEELLDWKRSYKQWLAEHEEEHSKLSARVDRLEEGR